MKETEIGEKRPKLESSGPATNTKRRRWRKIQRILQGCKSESFEEKKSKETRKYHNLVKSLFDYEIFYDNENKVTLACTIDSIKPNDSISLPCYLFIKNKEGFLIDYEINSKNLPSKIVGTLTVNDI